MEGVVLLFLGGEEIVGLGIGFRIVLIRNGLKMVGNYVPHVLKELFIVVDQRTWSRVQRVTIPSN